MRRALPRRNVQAMCVWAEGARPHAVTSPAMQDDHIFRLILAFGLAVVLPVTIYHRARSQASREKLDRRQEGLFILLTLRPTGLASMIGLLTFVTSPSQMAWSSVPLPLQLRWVGVGVGIVAAFLLIWTLRSLGINLTDTVVTRQHHTLVTSGPYRFVRHPFYVASALAIFANALATANWFIALTGGLAMTLLVMRTATEEEHLTKRFGDDYVGYIKQTGRFLPRIVHRGS